MQNLPAPSIFQEECRIKIEHVQFPSVFFLTITDPYIGTSFSLCSHDPIFVTNKYQVLEIGSYEQTLTEVRQCHMVQHVKSKY